MTKDAEEARGQSRVHRSVGIAGLQSERLGGRCCLLGYDLKAGCKLDVTNGRCMKGMRKGIECGMANHSLSTCGASN